jgi:CheY-like chemotaxis protein
MIGRYLDDRRVIPAASLEEASDLVAQEHPAAIIVNQAPGTVPPEPTAPIADPGFSVPILRCSIPSPSWLQQTMGIQECLTKPVTREALYHVLQRVCKTPGDILVVDDDPGFVALMTRLLQSAPLVRELIPAYSGEQAIVLAQKKRPDVLFVDLLMPDTSGFDVIQTIQSDPDLQDIKLVLVTATSYAEDALQQRSTAFSVTQARGLETDVLIKLLNATLSHLRPDYVSSS